MKAAFRTIILSILVLGLISVHLAAQVEQVNDTTGGMAELPYVKVMKDGNIMVIYGEGHHFNNDFIMYYKILNTQTNTWSSQKKAVDRFRSSAYPQLASDNEGNLHLAYHDGSSSAHRDIWYAMFDIDKYEWKPKKMVYASEGVNSTWPRIQVDPDTEKIYVVWSHNYGTTISAMDLCMVENPFDGLWPVEKGLRLTISDSPGDVSIHGDFAYRDGKVYAVWMDDANNTNQWSLYYNDGKRNPTTGAWSFGTPTYLFPSTQKQYYPAITLDDNGDVHVLFSHKGNPMFHTKKTGETWSNPKPITDGATDQNMFAVLVFKAGLLHTVFRQGTDVFYARALSDGNWTKPVKIADGQFPGYPGIDADEQGNAHVVFSDGDPDHPRQVYYTKVTLPGKAPDAVAKANPDNGLTPLTVNFDGSASSDADGKIKDYNWSFGDGASANGKKVSYTYKTAGTFTATLTVIDDDLRTGADSVVITAHTGAPQALFIATPNTGMRPLTVIFDASPSEDFDGEIEAYAWDFGDGTGDSGILTQHVYENGGDYEVVLTVTDNEGRTGKDEQIIDVFQPPVAIFTADPTVGVPPLTVHFDGRDSYDEDGEIKNNRWDFGDGLIGGSPQQDHVYGSPGIFTAIYTVTDDDGYTGTTMKLINILDRPLPPVNVKNRAATNRAGFYTEYINMVTWIANPDNEGLFPVASYYIYRKPLGADDSQYTLRGQVSGSTYTFNDAGFSGLAETDNYEYAVTSVDDEGNESVFSSQLEGSSGGTVQTTAESERSAIK
ncbi:MAG: PKD domain-containing protein [Candidatus Aminicenantaceae bacterium]